jgi:hypothetical protein
MRPDGNGKGDKPRPLGVPLEKFDSNWDTIFKKGKDEGSTGHRNQQSSQQDMDGSNKTD